MPPFIGWMEYGESKILPVSKTEHFHTIKSHDQEGIFTNSQPKVSCSKISMIVAQDVSDLNQM